MVRTGVSAHEPITLADDQESFTFVGHAYVRCGATAVTVRGDLQAMTLDVGDTSPQLTVNGISVKPTLDNGFLHWQQ